MTNETITRSLIFIAGGAIGSITTFFLVKGRYQKKADEEIAEMKQHYMNKYNVDLDVAAEKLFDAAMEDTNEDDESEDSIPAKTAIVGSKKSADNPSLSEYKDLIEKRDYAQYYEEQSKQYIEGEEADNKMSDDPYVISPEEFGDMDDYDEISLTYYSDGFLVDDNDELLDAKEIEDAIGWDALDRFGEYEDDSVHVRNDRRKCDYEILRDSRKYMARKL